MMKVTTKEWVFTSAQTDVKLEDVGAAQRMGVLYAQVTAANSNTGDVSVRLGLATATLPTISDNSLTGGAGVFLSHGGIAKGGGAIATNGGQVLAVGGLGEDLRLTCSAATGGSIRVVVTFRIEDDQEAS